ncbi:MAG: response regulator [Candidatus Kariarchaeaceae archaeon]|jgi:CheY-like chemotaxis protein
MGSRILVVDDEPMVRKFVKMSLVRQGYDVHEAASGEEALEAIYKTPSIDLLITDIQMPGMNGYELVEQTKSKVKKVLMITGYYYRSAEGIPLLRKPFNYESLSKKVHEMLQE